MPEAELCSIGSAGRSAASPAATGVARRADHSRQPAGARLRRVRPRQKHRGQVPFRSRRRRKRRRPAAACTGVPVDQLADPGQLGARAEGLPRLCAAPCRPSPRGRRPELSEHPQVSHGKRLHCASPKGPYPRGGGAGLSLVRAGGQKTRLPDVVHRRPNREPGRRGSLPTKGPSGAAKSGVRLIRPRGRARSTAKPVLHSLARAAGARTAESGPSSGVRDRLPAREQDGVIARRQALADGLTVTDQASRPPARVGTGAPRRLRPPHRSADLAPAGVGSGPLLGASRAQRRVGAAAPKGGPGSSAAIDHPRGRRPGRHLVAPPGVALIGQCFEGRVEWSNTRPGSATTTRSSTSRQGQRRPGGVGRLADACGTRRTPRLGC